MHVHSSFLKLSSLSTPMMYINHVYVYPSHFNCAWVEGHMRYCSFQGLVGSALLACDSTCSAWVYWSAKWTLLVRTTQWSCPHSIDLWCELLLFIYGAGAVPARSTRPILCELYTGNTETELSQDNSTNLCPAHNFSFDLRNQTY